MAMRYLVLLAISILIGTVIALQLKKPIVGHNTAPDTFSFSLDSAPPASLKGNITSLSGDILWQSRTATEASIIKSPQLIQQGEELDASDSVKVSVIFSNVAQININNNSSVYFAQTLPVDIVMQQKSGIVQYEKKSSTTAVSVRVLHALIEIQNTSYVSIQGSMVTISGPGPTTIAFNNLQNVSQVITIPSGYIYTLNDQTRHGKLIKDLGQ